MVEHMVGRRRSCMLDYTGIDHRCLTRHAAVTFTIMTPTCPCVATYRHTKIVIRRLVVKIRKKVFLKTKLGSTL